MTINKNFANLSQVIRPPRDSFYKNHRFRKDNLNKSEAYSKLHIFNDILGGKSNLVSTNRY